MVNNTDKLGIFLGLKLPETNLQLLSYTFATASFHSCNIFLRAATLERCAIFGRKLLTDENKLENFHSLGIRDVWGYPFNIYTIGL